MELESAICYAPVPDIIHDDLATFVKYMEYHAVISRADTKQIVCARKFVCIVRNRLGCQSFNMLKNVRDNLFRNFPKIFFSALFLEEFDKFFSSSRFR